MLNRGLSRYFSPADLAELARVRVGLAGAGGLGSNCAMLLVRSGVKRLTIVDFDLVEPSNLNRQFFFPEDCGRPKVAALGERLLRLSPDLDLRLINERLSAENAPALFADCAVVVEALDRAEYKATLFGCLAETGVFMVGASGLGGLGGPAMRKRRLGANLICVGDFESAVDEARPPLAPRVMQAAALEAEAVLEFILRREL